MGDAQFILSFWFDEAAPRWWAKDPDFDQEIRDRFMPLWEEAKSGKLEHWKQSPEGALAWILLLDQFSRNMFRDRLEAFAQDSLALQAALLALQKGWDLALPPERRAFFYMPLMHAEDRKLQRQAVEKFRELVEAVPAAERTPYRESWDFAKRHAEIVERFGRFPHRNQVLGRESTAEEVEFLKQAGSSF